MSIEVLGAVGCGFGVGCWGGSVLGLEGGWAGGCVSKGNITQSDKDTRGDPILCRRAYAPQISSDTDISGKIQCGGRGVDHGVWVATYELCMVAFNTFPWVPF